MSEIEEKAFIAVKSVQITLDTYLKVMEFKPTLAPIEMNMAYNTLEGNLKGYHPKLEVLLRVEYGLFNTIEEEVFPGYPATLSKHMNRNELDARIFNDLLGNDAVRIKQVTQQMIALSMGEIPSLAELEQMYDDFKKVK